MTTPEIIVPVPVARTCDGYWCHPALSAFYNDREYVANTEYTQWLMDHGLEDNLVWQEDEVGSLHDPEWLRQADFSTWAPPEPEGEGWFIGAIYEDEDNGPVCIWLRRREVSCAEH